MPRGLQLGTAVLWPLAALALALAPVAPAHPHDYVLGSSEAKVVRCDSADEGRPGVGGVCIRAGHVLPDSDGMAQLEVVDTSLLPVSAVYCQDPDANDVCGERDEPFERFCGEEPLTVGVNWDPELDIWVLADGPVTGNALLSVCHTLVSMGTAGSVYHWP